jgi:Domain of unknown function (DUF5916)/Carbohydrate family 9 binding domain-like
VRSAGGQLSRLVILLTAAVCSPPAVAQQSPAPVASASASLPRLPRSTAEVTIDGVLDDPVWKDALVIDLTTETNPGENVPASVETHAYLVEDGTRLLIAFDARDPDPKSIRAYLRDRDRAFNDDFVGIVIDSFGDRRYAYEFFANALGVQMDLTNDDVTRRESTSWDAIWDSAGKINSQGFAVEMAIPLSQLRFRNTDGERTWGIDVLRFRPRADRTRISNNPQERGRNCYLCQFSQIRGLEGVEPGKNLEIVPSLTGSRTDQRPNPATDPWQRGDFVSDVGLNVRWGVTQALTANLALNPDFSQVEADVAQLDINNQFALFYPESRPFFLEGADYFTTPIQAVFTRTIADPRIGVKLTGQPSDSTLGVFATEDEVTNLLFPGALDSSSTSLDQSNDAFVGRYSRNTAGNAQLGALFTSRSGDGYHNHVGGLDGLMRIGGRHTLRAQYLFSNTEYPDATATSFSQPLGSFDGSARQLRYTFNHREWYADLTHKDFDTDFRADAGFLPQVGIEQDVLESAHIWQRTAQGQKWKQIQVGLNATRTLGEDGRLLDRNLESVLSFNGPMQSYLQIGGGPAKRYWNGQMFEGSGVFFYGQIRPRGGLSVQLFARDGKQVDFANTRLADEIRLRPNVEWNVNQHLLVRLQHTYNRLDTEDGQRIFKANLSDLRVTWQFNVRSFIRFTTQRQDIERNVAVYTDPTTQARSLTVGTQLLYSYKVNPQTVLYVGYADNSLEDDSLLDLTRTSRTLFAKLSYAWLH